MSQSGAQSPFGFGIFDLLTRVVPGTVALGVFMLIPYPTFTVHGSTSNLMLILLGLLAFVLGEIINLIRLTLYPVPRTFLRLIYEQSGGKTQRSLIDKLWERIPLFSPRSAELVTATQKDFWSRISDEFGLEGFVQGRDIYFIFLDSIEPEFPRRLERLQASYHFSVNMAIVGLFSILASVYVFIMSPGDTNTAIALLIFIAFVPLVFILSISVFGLEQKYIGSLVRLYYTRQ